MPDPQLYLASQSPRRRELLQQLGLVPALIAAAVDETPLPDEPAAAYVERLARAKALAGWYAVEAAGLKPLPVLGADTSVVLDGEILGKPCDERDACAMLARLAGRTHQVLTGVSLCTGQRQLAAVSHTEVTFGALDAGRIERYCATGEPLDKAGGYGIQGAAAAFVARIVGSYTGVVGLPLFETAELLRQFGIEC